MLQAKTPARARAFARRAVALASGYRPRGRVMLQANSTTLARGPAKAGARWGHRLIIPQPLLPSSRGPPRVIPQPLPPVIPGPSKSHPGLDPGSIGRSCGGDLPWTC